MRLPKFISVIVLVLSSSVAAMACWGYSVPASAEEELQKHTLIFVGKAEWMNREIIRFSVQEVFAGNVASEVVMNRENSSCSFHFEQGKTYLIYTRPEAKGYLEGAGVDSRTAELSAAAADLAYLRAHVTAKPDSNRQKD